QTLVDGASADTRFALFVLAVVAVLALALTAIGVYGAVAFATARRTREIAVRKALGANARTLVALIVRQSLAWVAGGVVAGALGARLLSRSIQTLLFQVTATDTATFIAVASLMAVVALVASAVPAIRAARVDPMLALRSE